MSDLMNYGGMGLFYVRDNRGTYYPATYLTLYGTPVVDSVRAAGITPYRDANQEPIQPRLYSDTNGTILENPNNYLVSPADIPANAVAFVGMLDRADIVPSGLALFAPKIGPFDPQYQDKWGAAGEPGASNYQIPAFTNIGNYQIGIRASQAGETMGLSEVAFGVANRIEGGGDKSQDYWNSMHGLMAMRQGYSDTIVRAKGAYEDSQDYLDSLSRGNPAEQKYARDYVWPQPQTWENVPPAMRLGGPMNDAGDGLNVGTPTLSIGGYYGDPVPGAQPISLANNGNAGGQSALAADGFNPNINLSQGWAANNGAFNTYTPYTPSSGGTTGGTSGTGTTSPNVVEGYTGSVDPLGNPGGTTTTTTTAPTPTPTPTPTPAPTPTPSSSSSSSSSSGYPIVLDLAGTGIRITARSESNTFFDMAGDGYQHRTAWAGAGNGVLVLDLAGNGQITQRNQVVFTDWDPTARNDMQALANVFDTNHDGRLSVGDANFASFKVLVTNADGNEKLETASH